MPTSSVKKALLVMKTKKTLRGVLKKLTTQLPPDNKLMQLPLAGLPLKYLGIGYNSNPKQTKKAQDLPLCVM